MTHSFVVHYQEIALKGKNRPWFLAQLVRSLRRAVSDLDVHEGPRAHGPHRGRAGPGALARRGGRAHPPHVRHRQLLAGAAASPLDLDAIAAAILRDLGDRTCRSFRVSARRADKRFPLTSPQIEREVGGRIKEAKGWRVDLERAGDRRSASSC